MKQILFISLCCTLSFYTHIGAEPQSLRGASSTEQRDLEDRGHRYTEGEVYDLLNEIFVSDLDNELSLPSSMLKRFGGGVAVGAILTAIKHVGRNAGMKFIYWLNSNLKLDEYFNSYSNAFDGFTSNEKLRTSFKAARPYLKWPLILFMTYRSLRSGYNRADRYLQSKAYFNVLRSFLEDKAAFGSIYLCNDEIREILETAHKLFTGPNGVKELEKVSFDLVCQVRCCLKELKYFEQANQASSRNMPKSLLSA